MRKNYFLKFRKALMISAVSLSVTTFAQQWNNVGTSAVVSTGFSSYNNLAIDASGNYYISYYDVSAGKGSVQKFDGTSWSYVGGSAGITTGLATYSSLALDMQGNIYYSNQAAYPDTGMEMRKFSSGSWAVLPQPTTSTVNFQATAVSPSTNTLFAYSSDDSGTVRRYNNGIWEQVGDAGFAGGSTYAEMAIGSDNNIYTVQFAGGVVLVYKISANATSSDTWTLVGGSPVGSAYAMDNSYCDIALDGNNVPYVVYVSNAGDGRKLNVKKFDENSWVQIGTANFTDTVVNNAAITVSPDGTPYVIAGIWDYSNPNHGKNSVYTTNGGNWEKVGSPFLSSATATYNDIAFDTANNNLVVTYSEGGMRVKRFALNNLSVNDVKNKDTFGVYPNPTNGIVYFKDEKTIKSLEVVNVVGQKMSTGTFGNQIDISDAPKGIYFIKATHEDGKTSVKKLIKK
ncbi:T9SS type A sorting domain-containing protein [Chryseobacterium sp. SSA4.19]|uniref:T9SS type A sorting domain-containing protein n=1 Tax=Chryseobacterium sp. SSA4.19 TaxID=2919915 RepID=UPI001F4E3DC5|nr:T9SS type A sorting domain-containing protein [Chryseobacterium sp. SSA4.19]MCJ8154388.1 T9SS type A sorting domain-containing protein [Chryseobacterium sp. SSA4.19]